MKKFFVLSTSAIVLSFTACQEEEYDNMLDNSMESAVLKAEEAFPGENGTPEKGYLFGKPIEYLNINRKAVFQGDIILTEEQMCETISRSGASENDRTEGTGRSYDYTRWPDNTVYFTIDPALPYQDRVFDAIAHWEALTDIKFVRRTSESNYLTFTDDGGCYSYVGMIGGNQWISVGLGCSTGSTIHEIGHALGLWHEQSRADRDNYIVIHEENISPENFHNFQTYQEQGFDGFDHGPFDFGSIMMYPAYAFSENGLPTITLSDGSIFYVQRDELSAGDLAIIDFMYPTAPTGPAAPVPMDVEQLIAVFDDFVLADGLVGSGPGRSADHRLKAFRSMLVYANRLIGTNQVEKAIDQLTSAQKRIHTAGEIRPSHFVKGTEAQAFYNMLKEVTDSI